MLVSDGGQMVDSAHLIVIPTEFDTSSVPALRMHIEQLLKQGTRCFELDCSKVTYADSAALGLLVWLDRAITEDEGWVSLRHVTPQMYRVLDIANILPFAQSLCVTSVLGAPSTGSDSSSEQLPSWIELHRVTPEIPALSDARHDIERSLARLGFSSSVVDDLRIAIGEALANAVKHGLEGAENPTLEVLIKGYPNRVVIDVVDNGRGFDGSYTPPSDAFAPDGRGILFMRALMDTVSFTKRAHGGTLVHMVKHKHAL